MSLGVTFGLINKLIRAYHLVVMAFKRRFFGMKCQTCQASKRGCLCVCLGCGLLGAAFEMLCARCVEVACVFQHKKDPVTNSYAELRRKLKAVRRHPPKRYEPGQESHPRCYIPIGLRPRWMSAMYETTEWFQPLPKHIRGEGFVLLYPRPDLEELHERCTRRLFLSLSWISLRNVYVRGEEGAKVHRSVVKTEGEIPRDPLASENVMDRAPGPMLSNLEPECILSDLRPEQESPEGEQRIEGEILTSMELGTSQDLPPLFGELGLEYWKKTQGGCRRFAGTGADDLPVAGSGDSPDQDM